MATLKNYFLKKYYDIDLIGIYSINISKGILNKLRFKLEKIRYEIRENLNFSEYARNTINLIYEKIIY